MIQPDIRVVIVDDHNVVRSGLRLLLEGQPQLSVVGEAASGQEAIGLIEQLAESRIMPDLVVMDLMMGGGLGGLEATRRIKQRWPSVAVLVLTMADDRAYLDSAMAAGASGYVLKDAVAVELVTGVRTVAAGGRYVALSNGHATKSRRVPLSAREIDVLRLVAKGYSNREIASELVLSVRTVETHKSHIMQKTGLRARSELTRFAVEAGLLR